MEGTYGKYLPDILDEYYEFQKLNSIESDLLDEALYLKNKAIENQWIESADRDGLEKFASIAGVTERFDNVDLEEFRDYIFFTWNNAAPYTMWDLKEWLDGYCGEDFYELTMDYDEYSLRVVMELDIKDKIDFVMVKLRAMVPANIVVNVHVRYNTYGIVGKYKNRLFQSNNLTHRQIAEEDLDKYSYIAWNTYNIVSKYKNEFLKGFELSHKEIKEENLNQYSFNTYKDLNEIMHSIFKSNEIKHSNLIFANIQNFIEN